MEASGCGDNGPKWFVKAKIEEEESYKLYRHQAALKVDRIIITYYLLIKKKIIIKILLFFLYNINATIHVRILSSFVAGDYLYLHTILYS